MYKPGASLPQKNLGRDDRRDGPVVRIGLLPLFLLIWAVPPLLLRAVTAWRYLPDTAETVEAVFTLATQVLMSAPQDLFVAVQCLLVVRLVRKLLTNRGLGERGPLIVGGVATTLYMVTQLLVFADYLYFTKTGVRFDLMMVKGLPSWPAWRAALLINGVMPLLCGVGTLLTLGMYAGQYVRALKPRHKLTSANRFWMAVIAVAGCASWWFTPDDIRSWNSNVLVKEQGNAVYRLATKRQNKRPPIEEADLLTGCRLNEQASPVSPAYPLLKETRQFSGPTAFQLRIHDSERPHVVCLQIEGFRAANIGALGAKRPASPHFDSWSKKGVLFTQFYANGVQPGSAAVASLYGIWPRFAMIDSTRSQPGLPLLGLPNLLRERGYRNTYVNGRLRDFESSSEFFKQHGFDDLHGVNEMLETVPGGGRSAFGVHDEVLVQHLVEWLKKQDKVNQPTFLYAQTNTNRRPWQVPNSFQPQKAVPTEPGANNESLLAFQYSDACFGAFMRLLRDAKLDTKTIVVVYGSSGVTLDEHSTETASGLAEESVRVPLLILAPGRLDKPTTVAELGSQVDVAPTLMDVLGLTGENVAVGNSLLRKGGERTVFFANPFGPQGLGFRTAEWKYIYCPQAHESVLYDLGNDAGESRNVAAERPDVVERLQTQAQGLNQWMSRLYMRETIAPRTDVRAPRSGN